MTSSKKGKAMAVWRYGVFINVSLKMEQTMNCTPITTNKM
jgi:hypothetical protein